MKPKHLSYKRAIMTCLENQHLIGKAFSPEQPAAGRIRRVLIAPYNRILRWQFLTEVFAGAEPDRALNICRDGKYEVVLLSEHYGPDQEQHCPKTLGEYLQECDSLLAMRPAGSPANSPVTPRSGVFANSNQADNRQFVS